MRATALFTPDATPASPGPASASTVVVSGATVSDSPSEKTRSAGTDVDPVVQVLRQARVGEHAERRRSSARAAMNSRGPYCIESRRMRGERKNMTIVIGQQREAGVERARSRRTRCR